MPKQELIRDLYTFVAGDALKGDLPFPLKCNCGGTVAFNPPFCEAVVCPKCSSKINIIVLKGDLNNVIGQDMDGNPILLPVQGSTKPFPTPSEHDAIKRDLKERQKIAKK